MSTNNFVQRGANVGFQPPATQPTEPGLWLNGGVLMFWDGVQNKPIDFNEGPNSSVFGVPLGDQ